MSLSTTATFFPEGRQNLEAVLFGVESEVRDLAEEFSNGGIDYDSFLERMADLIEEAGFSAAACAMGGAQHVEADGFQIARKFGEACRSRLNKLQVSFSAEDRNLIAPRAVNYCRAARSVYEQVARQQASKVGFSRERRLLADDGCCPDCRILASQGWQPMGTLPAIGATSSGADCACSFDFGNAAISDRPLPAVAPAPGYTVPSDWPKLTEGAAEAATISAGITDPLAVALVGKGVHLGWPCHMAKLTDILRIAKGILALNDPQVDQASAVRQALEYRGLDGLLQAAGQAGKNGHQAWRILHALPPGPDDAHHGNAVLGRIGTNGGYWKEMVNYSGESWPRFLVDEIMQLEGVHADMIERWQQEAHFTDGIFGTGLNDEASDYWTTRVAYNGDYYTRLAVATHLRQSQVPENIVASFLAEAEPEPNGTNVNFDWDSNLHPRGERGRFGVRGSDSAQAAAEKMSQIIQHHAAGGAPDPSHLNDLLGHMQGMTVKQLHELKKNYGLKASGKNRSELIQKLSGRLHAQSQNLGRRAGIRTGVLDEQGNRRETPPSVVPPVVAPVAHPVVPPPVAPTSHLGENPWDAALTSQADANRPDHERTFYDWRRNEIGKVVAAHTAAGRTSDAAHWTGRMNMTPEQVANDKPHINAGPHSANRWRAMIAQAHGAGNTIPEHVIQSDSVLRQHGPANVNTHTGQVAPPPPPPPPGAPHTLTHEAWRNQQIGKLYDHAKNAHDRESGSTKDSRDNKARYAAIMQRMQKVKDNPELSEAYTKADHAAHVAHAMVHNLDIPDAVKAQHPALATAEGRAEAMRPVDHSSMSTVGGTLGTDGTVKHGPSTAKVEIGYQASTGPIMDRVKKFFGPNGTLQDVASVMGIPHGLTLNLSLYNDGIRGEASGVVKNKDGTDRIDPRTGKPVGIEMIRRTLRKESNGDKAIHNDYFRVKGAGEEFNGYYTWPRFGYDQKLSSHDSKKIMNEHFPRAATIGDVMKTSEGRDAWLLHGSDISTPDAVFDLSHNSRSQRTLANYEHESEQSGRTSGVGREIFARQVENATKHGFKQIDTHAAGHGPAPRR